jgi:two-component system, cell cycle response regulator DivK
VPEDIHDLEARDAGRKQTKILIVEDEEDIREILVLRLHYMGEFAIREASNGQEALECIAQDPPDIVLLDLKLPVLDGWETARRIRALPAPLSHVPIIAVTAYAMRSDRAKASAAGCDEYITKPIVDFRDVQAKMERLLTCGGRGELAGGIPA